MLSLEAALVKTLYSAQICSGILSFAASTLIAIMIVHSESRLASPFRRIIFALSAGDILQSLASIIGPFVTMPTPGFQSSIFGEGNQLSCDMQGFMILSGGTLCASYTLSLCIYFLCAVKYEMSDQKFATTVEWKLHTAALILSLGTSAIYVSLGLYNNLPDGNMCFVIEWPNGCHRNLDLDCDRGENATDIILYLTMIPLMFIFVGISYSLINLLAHVREDANSQQMIFRSSLNGSQRSANNSKKSLLESMKTVVSTFKKCKVCRVCTGTSMVSPPNSSGADFDGYLTRGERRAMRRRRESCVQAFLYVGGYLFIYMWPMITYFGFYRWGNNQPIILTIVVHFFFPLQGILNIFVYTRPKVSALQRRHPEFTWLKCLWLVVKGGGLIPIEYQQRRRLRGRASLMSSSIRIVRGPRDDPHIRDRRTSLQLMQTHASTSLSGQNMESSSNALEAQPQFTHGNDSPHQNQCAILDEVDL